MMRFMGESLTEKEIQVGYNQLDVLTMIVLLQIIIDEADMDQDGLIDYTEFFKMMHPTK